MKLLIATNATPFVRGGAELLADRLVSELRRAGHDTDLFRIPLGETPDQVLDSTIAAGLAEIVNVDRVIALKYPAYLVPHPEVVVWLVHQFRQAYDPPPVGWAPGPTVDPAVAAVRTADMAALSSVARRLAISPVVADRLRSSTGLEAEILLTPPHTDLSYRCEDAEPYIVALGRISDGKRQILAVRAMRHATAGFRLVVAGAADDEGVLTRIRAEIDVNGLDDRVELIPRFISDEEKLDLLARCLASVYLPVDEDSYSYVCYEASMSGKPSITATDSGGVSTIVRDHVTGLVVDPEPEAIAAAFDELSADHAAARALGQRAKERVTELDLSWERVVTELTR